MRTPSRTRTWTVIAALAAGLAACDSTNVIGPENQLQVGNNTDAFQFQATALDNVKQTLTYNWQMTGTVANVNHSGSATGTATLIMEGADGTQVYTRTLTEGGSYQTSAGAAGTWVITVVLDGVSGAVNFRVEKP